MSSATLEETVQWALDYEAGGGFDCGKKKKEKTKRKTETKNASDGDGKDGGDGGDGVNKGDGIDWDNLSNLIPFMHPNEKPLTWR